LVIVLSFRPGVASDLAVERIHSVLPDRPVWAEPGVEFGEWFRTQAVDAVLGVALDIDEAGVSEHSEVA
jgi:hypothetical protein